MAVRAFNNILSVSRSSPAWYFNSSGVLTQVANDTPRFDYDPGSMLFQGLMVEESRANSIRNNSMTGAVAGVVGSGGSIPTNWILSKDASLTATISTGTESGISYIDVRLSGTPGATSTTYIYFDANTAIAATSGQTWSLSSFVSMSAGSTTNIASQTTGTVERDSGGTALSGGFSSTLNLSTGPLIGRRAIATGTLSGGTTAFVQGRIALGVISGAAIDITLRIGAPQLELGAFVTSPILTTNAAVTRGAEVISFNTLAPWFNQNEGTIYMEWLDPILSTGTNAYIFSTSDLTLNNRVSYFKASDGSRQLRYIVGGVTGVSASVPSSSFSVKLHRDAIAFKNGDFQYVYDGTLSTSGTPTGVPSVTKFFVGSSETGTTPLNGWIRAIKYKPYRMTNAELQQITTLPTVAFGGATMNFNFKTQAYNLEHI